MPQPSQIPSFWIPGGVLLLIVGILSAPLLKLATENSHSDLTKNLVVITSYLLRVLVFAGIICIAVGLVVIPLIDWCKKRK